MLKRLILSLLILDISFHGFGLLSKFKKKSKPKPPPAQVALVETIGLAPVDHTLRIETQGTVRALVSGSIGTEVAGRILEISSTLKEGSRVNKGDMLLTIDPTAYEVALAKSLADLSMANVAHKEEEARGEQALREWEAAGSLTDGKPSDLVLRKPQLELAKAQLKAAEAAVTLASQNLERTKVLAPFTGVITAKLVEAGQIVGAGAPIARAYGTESMEISLPLSSLEAGFLPKESQALVELEVETGTGTWLWQATIDRDAGTIDPQTRLHHVIAKVDLNSAREGAPELLPGQFAKATIQAAQLRGVFRIPREAYRNDGSVFLVTAEDRLLRKEVHVLHREQAHLVVDQGLQAGETLCLSRLNIMNDRMKVRRAGSAPVK